jgi:hypothetical protein
MSQVKIWYMRDNHTFLKLPSEVDKAMVALREEFVERLGTYGALCTKQGPKAGKMEQARASWSEFAPRARAWLTAALGPTAAEIEYASWIACLADAEPAPAQPQVTFEQAEWRGLMEHYGFAKYSDCEDLVQEAFWLGVRRAREAQR